MNSDEYPPNANLPQRRIRQRSLTIDVATWAYGTVSLMAVLVVYDDWTADIRFLGVVTVVVGPTLALALAHLFAKALEFHIQESRRPSAAQWRHLIAHAAQFLMVAIPPTGHFVCHLSITRPHSEQLDSNDAPFRSSVARLLGLGRWSSVRLHRLQAHSAHPRQVLDRPRHHRLSARTQAALNLARVT